MEYASFKKDNNLYYGRVESRFQENDRWMVELYMLCGIGEGGWSDSVAGLTQVKPAEELRLIDSGSLTANDQYAGFEIDGANPDVIYAPVSSPTDEDFPTYLRRVAGDFKESGNDATAEDYETAAAKIDKVLSIVKNWERRWVGEIPVGFRAIRETLTER